MPDLDCPEQRSRQGRQHPPAGRATHQDIGAPAPLLDDALAYFKAYDRQGRLSCAIWTSHPATEAMERATFQARLDRGELVAVDIAYGDPRRRNETLLGSATTIAPGGGGA